MAIYKFSKVLNFIKNRITVNFENVMLSNCWIMILRIYYFIFLNCLQSRLISGHIDFYFQNTVEIYVAP